MFYYNIPCAALFVFFVPWVDGICCLVCPAVIVINHVQLLCEMLVCFLFCREVMGAAVVCVKLCEYLFVFFFLLWVDVCCMVIRKLQVIEIPCAATVCLCSVIRSFCVLFCSENWWKLSISVLVQLMLFIVVNMIVSAIVCKWVLNIVLASVCIGASAWNICVCATVIAVWAAGFVTYYWNTCCSLLCVAVGVHIYKLCLFCEVSVESPVTVLGIQYLLLFRWFMYMLMCTVMVIRKEKKMSQGILNNIMRTKGEKIHVKIY